MAADTTDAHAWKRLGELLILRRTALDPRYRNRRAFADARGINYKLASDIEQAKRTDFSIATLAHIAASYDVTYESLKAALDGGDLEPAPAPRAAEQASAGDAFAEEISGMDRPAEWRAREAAGWRQAIAPRPGDPPLDDEEVAALAGFWRQWRKPETARWREIAAIRDHLAAQKRGELPAQRELRRNGTDDRPDPAA